MKKVITFGVFDYFHYGHLQLFKRAKQYGDYLIVAVQDGDYILKYKPQANIYYTTKQRIEMIEALSIVDEVVIYYDVDTSIKGIDFDVFVCGEDQNHSGFIRATDFAISQGKEVEILPRTKGVSSTLIKNNRGGVRLNAVLYYLKNSILIFLIINSRQNYIITDKYLFLYTI